MMCRIMYYVDNAMSDPHHPGRRGSNFFIDFETKEITIMVSKVNNFKNKRIKIAFKFFSFGC